MKRFIEKFKINKILISILIALLLFNFVAPNYAVAVVTSQASGSLLETADSIGGTLLKPVFSLIAFICDAILGMLANFMWPDGSMEALYDFSGVGEIGSDIIKDYDSSSDAADTMATFAIDWGIFGQYGLSEEFLGNGTLSAEQVKNNIKNWEEKYINAVKNEDGTYTITCKEYNNNVSPPVPVYSENDLTSMYGALYGVDPYNTGSGLYGVGIYNQLDDATQKEEQFNEAIQDFTESNQGVAVYNALGETFDNFFGSLKTHNDLYYSPEAIFSGKIDLLSINFITGKTSDGSANSNSGWNSIRSVISSWYKALRLVAIVGLLSMLIYTGIKILFSANSAQNKAKYKEWIINWFVAIAILFAMHYIMAFTVTVIDELSALVTKSFGGIHVVYKEGEFNTNLMGLMRFELQRKFFTVKLGYLMVYIAMITYTFKFTFIYLKRVLNMAFLTLIAPIVALTYPLDKMNDGSAQGFNMWLKEYVFNALLQPMHLIMYYVLVNSAVELTSTNPIYGLIVLGFMTEAERLLKKIFGFDKAHGGTVGGMGSAFAAGALASNLVKSVGRLGGGKGGNASKGMPEGEKSDSVPGRLRDTGIGNFANLNPGSASTPAPESIGQDDNNYQPFSQYGNSESNETNSNYNGAYNGYDVVGAPSVAGFYDSNEGQQSERQQSEGQRSQTDLDEDSGLPTMDDIGGDDIPTIDVPKDNTSNNEKSKNEGKSEEPQVNNDEPIKDMAERIRFRDKVGKGMAAVGKRTLKATTGWDLDKSASYNGKRLVRNVGKNVAKTALGIGLGLTTAAVQAGISITDGKYNPAEAVASFAAGFGAGGAIVNKVTGTGGNTISAFKEAYHSGDTDEEKRDRYVKDWKDRDDITNYYSNYAKKKNLNTSQVRELKERAASNYVRRGISNVKDIEAAMKYSSQLQKSGMSMQEADKIAASTMNFKKKLADQQSYGAIYDSDKRKRYIDSMVARGQEGMSSDQLRKNYENAFSAVLALNEAQKS